MTDESAERIRNAAAVLSAVIYGLLYLLRQYSDDRTTAQMEVAAVSGMVMMDDAVKAV